MAHGGKKSGFGLAGYLGAIAPRGQGLDQGLVVNTGFPKLRILRGCLVKGCFKPCRGLTHVPNLGGEKFSARAGCSQKSRLQCRPKEQGGAYAGKRKRRETAGRNRDAKRRPEKPAGCCAKQDSTGQDFVGPCHVFRLGRSCRADPCETPKFLGNRVGKVVVRTAWN